MAYGEHTFEAPFDGKYEYCFSNEAWSANSKEVSFNVHGVVYVPENELDKDPLEQEGTSCSLRICHSRTTPAPFTDITLFAVRQSS